MSFPSPPEDFKTIRIEPSQLNLSLVLNSGQTFRWHRLDLEQNYSEWRLALPDRVVCLRQNEEYVFYRTFWSKGSLSDTDPSDRTRQWIQDYFNLDVDLDTIFGPITDPVFTAARRRFGGGIRLLRQDPWEALISFSRTDLKHNNHLPRITSMVEKLCLRFSPPLILEHEDEEVGHMPKHPFPSPQTLAQSSVEPILRGLGFGYRAKYIQQTSALLCQRHDNPHRWLLTLREHTYQDAKQELLQLPGVGAKVADCIALMSMDKHEVIPIDTHMVSIATKRYNFQGLTRKSYEGIPSTLHGQIASFFQAKWGTYAGWAHSILFASDLATLAPKTPYIGGSQGNTRGRKGRSRRANTILPSKRLTRNSNGGRQTHTTLEAKCVE